MTSAATRRPLRKDAQRNRNRLVEEAAGAFRDRGLDVGVDEIAQRAGVNVATLYRHFPTKGHLVLAAGKTLLEPLEAACDEALTTGPGEHALARFLYAVMRLRSENRGLVDALNQQPIDREVRERLYVLATAVVEPVVERARRDGDLAEDLGVDDLLVVMRMVDAAAAPSVRPRDPRRYVDMMVRGLRPAAG